MSKVIDISVPLRPDMPIWPGDSAPKLHDVLQLRRGDTANVSRLDCVVHAGTHIDAPRHFLEEGATVEQLPLDMLIGPAVVAYMPDAKSVTAEELAILGLAPGTQRLLLRTSNSEMWAHGVKEFRKDYVALTDDAARWVVQRGIRLIGIDYLSVARYEEGPPTHRILLEAGVIILEGLNLSEVSPGTYELVCLPLKLEGAEGAPARTVLRHFPPSGSTCHRKEVAHEA